MDVFYNEFSTPQFFIKYNPQLPDLLSLAEVDGGITSFSLYDNKYSNENVTPFFRAKILDTTFSNEQVACILEWVSYPTLYFNPDTNFLSKYLCDEVKIVFLFAYDQLDAKTTVCVFTTCCVSAIFNLDGRKVIARILWRMKIMKI